MGRRRVGCIGVPRVELSWCRLLDPLPGTTNIAEAQHHTNTASIPRQTRILTWSHTRAGTQSYRTQEGKLAETWFSMQPVASAAAWADEEAFVLTIG